MFAAVDLGSNSFRLHVGMHEGSTVRIVRSLRDPVRLAAGLDSHNRLTPEAVASAEASLKRFRDVLEEFDLDAIRVVATNTLRVATNAAEILPLLEKAIGHPIEIISGEEEGRLIYMGVTSVLPDRNERKLIIDIGGGSTEVVLGAGTGIDVVESFTMGTVPHGLAFFPGGVITAQAYEAAILSARSQVEDAAPVYRKLSWDAAYGSSGTIRALAEVIGKNRLGELAMTLGSLNALKEALIRCGRLDRIAMEGLKAERAPVLIGGLAILIGVMQELGVQSVSPVDAGLRMGVLWDLQLRATRHDRREDSVRDFMQRFRVDPDRADTAARFAATLHALIRPASESNSRYLRWSAMLHESGMTLSHTGYHKHGAYFIEHADLAGFTTAEQHRMSQLILSQKGNLRKIAGLANDAELVKQVLALRLAVLFLHTRIDVNPENVRIKVKNRIEIGIPRQGVERRPTLTYWLGKERDHWQEIGIDFQAEFV